MINKVITLILLSLVSTLQVRSMENTQYELATLGAGCFWCVEAVFEEVKGIRSVKSGYMGGTIKNPTYYQVTAGTSGHAEVIQLEFDPAVITYAEILEIFWLTHDPTTLNRQGADVGTQYRSAIFYHSEDQKRVAKEILKKLESAEVYINPIVTEITAASEFYVAENYHQNYYALNGSQPYCQYVIKPKMDKFRKVFKDYLKQKGGS